MGGSGASTIAIVSARGALAPGRAGPHLVPQAAVSARRLGRRAGAGDGSHHRRLSQAVAAILPAEGGDLHPVAFAMRWLRCIGGGGV